MIINWDRVDALLGKKTIIILLVLLILNFVLGLLASITSIDFIDICFVTIGFLLLMDTLYCFIKAIIVTIYRLRRHKSIYKKKSKDGLLLTYNKYGRWS